MSQYYFYSLINKIKISAQIFSSKDLVNRITFSLSGLTQTSTLFNLHFSLFITFKK